MNLHTRIAKRIGWILYERQKAGATDADLVMYLKVRLPQLTSEDAAILKANLPVNFRRLKPRK